MSFIADKQTLEDLQLLGKYNAASIFSLFNRVRTRGGEKLLDQMFLHPLTDADHINSRSHAFRYFRDHAAVFPFEEAMLDSMESYLDEGSGASFPATLWHTARERMMAVLVKSDAYNRQLQGIQSCVAVLKRCTGLLQQLEQEGRDKGTPWERWADAARQAARHKQLERLLGAHSGGPLSLLQTARLHYLLTGVLQQQLRSLLQLIYEIDVFIAVAAVAAEKGFAFAVAYPADRNFLEATGVRHPRLDKGVPNPLEFNAGSNVLFLTGANMAGKSTLMKSTGIMLYLAHMGFPVAASTLQFSVLDGIYSSVNVPDDLQKGYSHFYAEVLRVKTVAEEVASGKRLFIIFDELFKGTNVKDAYDATLAVTRAFAGFTACFFIISTHIFEVGEALQQQAHTIRFVFLPTIMEGTVPRYTYRLQPGITADRQGMIIIENEGILEML